MSLTRRDFIKQAAADVGATPVPANYSCTQCHAAQASGGERVENTFEPYYRAKEQKEKSNLMDTLNEGVE